MPETWTLDGLALNDGTNYRLVGEVDLTPPKQRTDYITAADSEWAALLRPPLHENRQIVLPLEVVPQSTKDLTLDKVAALVDKLQKADNTDAGIALTWTPNGSTRTVTFDVLSAEITGLPLDIMHVEAKLIRPTVTLTCKPYWRGTEVTTSSASSAAPGIATLQLTSIPGDVPALGRLIVTNGATGARRHLEWGLESPQYYQSATSLIVDSDSMSVSGFAGSQITQSNTYDPNATGTNSILATVRTTPVSVAGTGVLSHVGRFRVKARTLASTPTPSVPGQPTYLRLKWQVGDGDFQANPWVEVPYGDWREADLGTISIPTATAGTQRWSGRLESYSLVSDVNGGQINIDYLLLVPLDAGYGKARAVFKQLPGALSANDEFTATTAGSALNLRAAPSGGSWATSGVAGDFVFADLGTAETVSRANTGDTGYRYGILGTTNYTDVEVSTDVAVTGTWGAGEILPTVIARYTDANNLVRLQASYSQLILQIIVAGVLTTIGTVPIAPATGTGYRLRLTVFASGKVIGELLDATTKATWSKIEGTHKALATGGTLASGKPGIADINTSANAATRHFDNFTVVVPPAEPIVMYPSRTLEVRADDVIRQDSTGTYYGRPSSYRGSRFLVQPGTSRVFVKARSNDVETGGDDDFTVGVSTFSIQVAYTPRGVALPR